MISPVLAEAALRSILLALAVWISLRIFRVHNVPAQKAAWGLVLASALLMPLVLPMVSHWSVLPANVRIVLPAGTHTLLEELQARIQAQKTPGLKPSVVAAPAGNTPSQGEQAEPSSISETAAASASAPVGPIQVEPDASSASMLENVQPQPASEPPAVLQPAVPQRAALSLSTIILLLYLAVAGVLLLRLAFGLVAALHLLRTAKPISDDSRNPLAAALDTRCSPKVASPVTICSSIVLPVDYRDWDSEKLRIVLAHERSHIRQRDFYLQLFAGIYAAVVWFSPLGWWLKRTLSDLAEAISDRAGLEEAADRTSYAQILLQFAATPRPTLAGVAMARSGSLSRRIERLLNDASFRQAFSGTRRALATVLVIPVALFAATALLRVQAAGQAPPDPPQVVVPAAGVIAPDAPVAPAAPETGVPAPPQAAAAPAPAAVEPPSPAPVCQPAVAPPVPPAFLTILPPRPPHAPVTILSPRAPLTPGSHALMILPSAGFRSPAATMTLIAPPAGYSYGVGYGYGIGQSSSNENGTTNVDNNGKHSGYHYSYSSNGESYAIIRGSGKDHINFSGDWAEGRREELDKARKLAGGKDILWFTHDGKSFFVDDPAAISQIEAMYKPMEELGKQQEALGAKQEELGKQQEELGRQQEQVSVPTPDMSKEIAEIDAAMAKLKAAQGKPLDQEQFSDIQEKIGELQGKLGEIQGQIGARQGEFGEKMGELGARQGELGAQQGELGAKQGKLAQEADQKIKSIIDQSLKNGKAHPVE
jgi:beta-lactamase regulating signal transducer with metallopeptidase domain